MDARNHILDQVSSHITNMKILGVPSDMALIARVFQDVHQEWRDPLCTQDISADSNNMWQVLVDCMKATQAKGEQLTNRNADVIIARFLPLMINMARRISASLTDDALRTIPIFRDRNDLDTIRNMIVGGYIYNVNLSLSNRMAEMEGFSRDKDLSALSTVKLLGAMVQTSNCTATLNNPIDPIEMASLLINKVKAENSGKYTGLFADITKMTVADQTKQEQKVGNRISEPGREARLAEMAARLKLAASQDAHRKGNIEPERKAKTAPVGSGYFGLPIRGPGDSPATTPLLPRKRSQSAAVMRTAVEPKGGQQATQPNESTVKSGNNNIPPTTTVATKASSAPVSPTQETTKTEEREDQRSSNSIRRGSK